MRRVDAKPCAPSAETHRMHSPAVGTRAFVRAPSVLARTPASARVALITKASELVNDLRRGPALTRDQLGLVVRFVSHDCRDLVGSLTQNFMNRGAYTKRPALDLSLPDGLSLWVHGWRPGDVTEIHKHFDAQTVVTVEGSIHERVFLPRGAGDYLVHARDLKPGVVVHSSDAHIHQVGNFDGKTLALSVHAANLHGDMELFKTAQRHLNAPGKWFAGHDESALIAR